MTQFDTAVPRSRSLPRDALVLAAGMAVANAGNYGFNLVMAFLLGPEAYGALAALLALVLVGSVPGLALQAVVARRTALAGPGTAWPGSGCSTCGCTIEPRPRPSSSALASSPIGRGVDGTGWPLRRRH